MFQLKKNIRTTILAYGKIAAVGHSEIQKEVNFVNTGVTPEAEMADENGILRNQSV